jgi:hypothetical protein
VALLIPGDCRRMIIFFYHVNFMKQPVPGCFYHLAPRLATGLMTLVAFVLLMPGAYAKQQAWAFLSVSGLQDTKNN